MLRQISKIEIKGNIKDLSVLNNIPNKYKNVKELLFKKCNDLNYFSFLSNLENLEVLHIYKSNIVDFSFLEKNIKIKELKLTKCKIKDFSSLSKLENLLILEVIDSEISDISFFERTKNIKKLNLDSYNPVEDFTFLSNLEKLEYLSYILIQKWLIFPF